MFRKQHPAAGSRPGTLQVPQDSPATRVRVMAYDKDRVIDREIVDAGQLDEHFTPDQIVWIDVQGFADLTMLHAIAERFQIHPLALEAMVNTPQRPKTEAYEEQLLVVGRLISMAEHTEMVVSQLGMIIGSNYLITFREQYSGHFDPVRQRINLPTSRLRSHGVDYLAYAIIDTAVDAAFPVLEIIGEQIEELEERVIANPHPRLIKEITDLKNQLLNLRRTIWPQREAIHHLIIDENDLIGETVRTFLRDTYNHCVQTGDVVEMYREVATGLLNTYVSSVAHRSNEVMKVLTIVSTIFVPLTFVAGIYGMNFNNMPELNSQYGYPLCVAIMVAIATGLLAFFYRKGWISISQINERASRSSSSEVEPANVTLPAFPRPLRSTQGLKNASLSRAS